MLRITTTERASGCTIALEGRLVGPWVDELETCWRAILANRAPGSIHVDLDAVVFVDADGKALLRTLHQAGTTLDAATCMTRAIVEEVTGAPVKT